jgi:hypothetical protein
LKVVSAAIDPSPVLASSERRVTLRTPLNAGLLLFLIAHLADQRDAASTVQQVGKCRMGSLATDSQHFAPVIESASLATSTFHGQA